MVADPVQPPVTTPVFEKTWVLKYMETGPYCAMSTGVDVI